MTIDSQAILDLVSPVVLTLLMVSIALSFIRLVRGPQASDRVVALDLICVLVIASLAAYSVYTGVTVFLDVAIAYALVAFLGTVALSRFLLRARRRRDERPPSRRAP
jgi:multicomponent Na+:H+ antiporter subunit F